MSDLPALRAEYEKAVRSSDFKPNTFRDEYDHELVVQCATIAVMLSKVDGFGETVILPVDVSDSIKKQVVREVADGMFDKLVKEHGTDINLSDGLTYCENLIYGDDDATTKA